MNPIISLLFFGLILSFLSCKNKSEVSSNITTTEDALQSLKNGNTRFHNNKLIHNVNYKEQIANTKYEQHPHTLVLGCIDSRVTPEIIFDQALGEMFVARVAGNVDDDYIIGSMEFAVKIKKTKLIVVLGHSHCGAIKGALGNVELEHLTELTEQIKPAISNHQSYPMEDEIADLTSKKNVEITIKHLLIKSKILRESAAKSEIQIIGAFYNITNGKVEFFE